MKKTLLFIAAILMSGLVLAQGTLPYSDPVVDNSQQPEDDPIILNRVAEWQDLKFGFMAHWGIYSQWGVVESWSICSEPWIDRKGRPYDPVYFSSFRLPFLGLDAA